MRVLLCCVAALLLCPAWGGDFSNWAAIVVAGDSLAQSGAPSEVFDNGRAAIARELVEIGFSPGNIKQFSTHPAHYKPHPGLSARDDIADGLKELAGRATGGCLAYLTSHGGEDGIVLGDEILTPRALARIVNKACEGRPAAVVVSACFSGVFVPKLKGPQRIVMTAAAADRSSFGCGEADKYTYFDTCTVEWLVKAGDFETFGDKVRACVRAREKEEGMSPPSNPQLAIGKNALALIPAWKKPQ
jgi:hypothetical protein